MFSNPSSTRGTRNNLNFLTVEPTDVRIETDLGTRADTVSDITVSVWPYIVSDTEPDVPCLAPGQLPGVWKAALSL